MNPNKHVGYYHQKVQVLQKDHHFLKYINKIANVFNLTTTFLVKQGLYKVVSEDWLNQF